MTVTISGTSGITTPGLTSSAASSFSADVTLAGSGVDLLNNSGNPVVRQAGSVLQVVQATKTDYASTTSLSFTDVTGLSVSITPTSSSSKILVLLSLGGTCNPLNTVKINIVRNSTNLAQPDSGTNPATINCYPGGGTGVWNNAINWLDSPATTSSTTYKVQWCVDGSTGYLNRHIANTNYNSVSTITVMEIAA